MYWPTMTRDNFSSYFAAWCVIYAPYGNKDDMIAFSNAKGIVFW